MKKLLFVLISSLATISLIAQSKPTGVPKFYVDAGAGPASHNGVFASLGGTAVLKQNWLASISYYNLDMTPKNLPSNYEPEQILVILFPFLDATPSVNMTVVNFTGGKLLPLGRKIWITAEAGLSIVSGEKIQFTPKAVEGDLFYLSANYSAHTTRQNTVGGMLRTNFNWAFTPYVGLSVGGFANLNSIQSPVGIEFKLTAGWLNTKKKK